MRCKPSQRRPFVPYVQTATDFSVAGLGFPARLSFRDAGRTLGVDVDEIDWVEAAGNYVQIYTARRTHLVRHTVKAMQAKLDPDRFVRVRPSAIVNVDRVVRIVHRPGGEYLITMQDGTQIASSRSFRSGVERVLVRRPAKTG